MNPNAKSKSASLYLLVGVLLFLASGVLAAAPHDHDPSEYCRVCSLTTRVEPEVDDHGTNAPKLEASTAPAVTEAADTSACLLTATPLRGPPATS